VLKEAHGFSRREYHPIDHPNRILWYTMHKWYENKTLLNILIFLMAVCFMAYFFSHWKWGLPLFLIFGTAIMIRGVTKITMRMRGNKTKPDSQNREI
jgi:hypothetical protein